MLWGIDSRGQADVFHIVHAADGIRPGSCFRQRTVHGGRPGQFGSEILVHDSQLNETCDLLLELRGFRAE